MWVLWTAKFGEGKEVREERVEDYGVKSRGGEPSMGELTKSKCSCVACAVGPPVTEMLDFVEQVPVITSQNTCNNKSKNTKGDEGKSTS